MSSRQSELDLGVLGSVEYSFSNITQEILDKYRSGVYCDDQSVYLYDLSAFRVIASSYLEKLNPKDDVDDREIYELVLDDVAHIFDILSHLELPFESKSMG